jgi:hypothetical protein
MCTVKNNEKLKKSNIYIGTGNEKDINMIPTNLNSSLLVESTKKVQE